jgi:beta-glucanase (GH16 family)
MTKGLLLVLVVSCTSAEQRGEDPSPVDTPRADAGVAVDATQPPPPPPKDAGNPGPTDAARGGWTITWRDEFDGPAGRGIDTSKWVFDVGGNGWGNSELQYYSDRADNARLDGEGHLVIRAAREAYKGRDYTSARLKTEGKFQQTYGRFEARAMMPPGRGLWPAFWLLGSNYTSVGWPASGEIDIMEFLGHDVRTIRGTLHGPGYSADRALSAKYSLGASKAFTDGFNVFAVEWSPGEIRFYVNEELYVRQTPQTLPAGTSWVFDGHPFFVILNLAVGGILPGSPDGTTPFPAELVVDHVRVYRKENP